MKFHLQSVLLASVLALFLISSGCNKRSQEPSPQVANDIPNDTQKSHKSEDSKNLNQKSLTQLLDVKEIYISQPVDAENFTIYPLIRKNPPKAKKYITLEQGLEKNIVIVKEIGNQDVEGNRPERGYNSSIGLGGNQAGNSNVGSNATVNAVEIVNNSKNYLYIIAGEIIIGGNQDRVITTDMVIEPNSKKRVDVCCVEHGRWHVRNSSDGENFKQVARALVQKDIKSKIQDSGTNAQGEVWSKISSCNSAIGNSNTSDTYHKFIKHNEKKITCLEQTLSKGMKDLKNICGVIVCINGDIIGLELFATPPIFNLFKERLINGYILDSVAMREKWDGKNNVTIKSVNEYLMDFSINQAKALEKGEAKFEGEAQKGYNSSLGLGGNISDGKVKIPLHSNSYKKEK